MHYVEPPGNIYHIHQRVVFIPLFLSLHARGLGPLLIHVSLENFSVTLKEEEKNITG